MAFLDELNKLITSSEPPYSTNWRVQTYDKARVREDSRLSYLAPIFINQSSYFDIALSRITLVNLFRRQT